MRTMAVMWFSVIVLLSIHNVFGDICQTDKLSCDECIRCGGYWCSERGMIHCKADYDDDWCPNDREYLPGQADVSKPGILLNPVYAERTMQVDKPKLLDFKYQAKTTPEPIMKILHSTQGKIELKHYETHCTDKDCITSIEAKPAKDFCNSTSGLSEYVEVVIDLGLNETARVKYYVDCACECSQIVLTKSPFCSGNGNFSCGVCSCDKEWTGEICETPTMPHVQVQTQTICDSRRGDVVQCSINPRNEADCSGNGYCDLCETCVCYTDRIGSQYFDSQNNCAGLCSIVNENEDCLVNGTLGECDSDIYLMFFLPYNVSTTEERDDENRIMWVKCNETFDDCGPLEYYAKKNEYGEVFVMMLNHCNEISVAAYVSDTKVPIILGVLGIIAAVAAVGGVMLWKHLNTIPPVPLNNSQYQNIDAEDCVGENPLYKSPMTMITNPTYGKW